jgi:dihydrofolate synthase / folylpolyglutamate synthase
VGAPLLREGVDFALAQEGPELVFTHGARRLDRLVLGLAGEHQRHNAAVALCLLDVLQGEGAAISVAARRAGLRSVRWPGRLEEVPGAPLLLLDGAHNPQGVEALLRALDTAYAGRRVHLVFAAVQDKDVGQMLARLLPRMASAILTPLPNTSRGLRPEAYLALAQAALGEVCVAESPAAALEKAVARAAAGEVVLVAGSLYLLGAVKAHLERAQAPARTDG